MPTLTPSFSIALLLLAAGARPLAADPDPCALVTQAEAAVALGTPAKPAQRSALRPACTYRASVAAGDPRTIDLVSVTIQDDGSFELPLHAKAFTIGPVSVGDSAYYYWSGRIESSPIHLIFRKHGTVVLIELSAYRGNASDPRSLTVTAVKSRELMLATHAAARLP